MIQTSAVSPLPREDYLRLRPAGRLAQINVIDAQAEAAEEHPLVLCHDGLWLGPQESIPLDAVLNARAGGQDGRLTLHLVYLDPDGRLVERAFHPRCSPQASAQLWCRLSELVEQRKPNAEVQAHVRRLYERRCEECGDLEADDARFMHVMSFLVYTNHDVYQARLCRHCTTRRGLTELLKSVTLGWWGPGGVLTFGALWINLTTLLGKSSLHPVVTVCVLPLLLGFPLAIGGNFVVGRLARWIHPNARAEPVLRHHEPPGEKAAQAGPFLNSVDPDRLSQEPVARAEAPCAIRRASAGAFTDGLLARNHGA